MNYQQFYISLINLKDSIYLIPNYWTKKGYNLPNTLQAIEYILSYWNTPQRDKAIQAVALQLPGINRELSADVWGLGALTMDSFTAKTSSVPTATQLFNQPSPPIKTASVATTARSKPIETITAQTLLRQIATPPQPLLNPLQTITQKLATKPVVQPVIEKVTKTVSQTVKELPITTDITTLSKQVPITPPVNTTASKTENTNAASATGSGTADNNNKTLPLIILTAGGLLALYLLTRDKDKNKDQKTEKTTSGLHGTKKRTTAKKQTAGKTIHVTI